MDLLRKEGMKRSNILLAFAAAGALAAGPVFAKRNPNETAPTQIKSSTLMEAQKKLNQEGFDAGRADGRWGTKTSEAVKSFQEKNNLPATGKLDEQTLADLGIGAPSATAGSVSKKQSSEPSESSGVSSTGQQNMMQRHDMECSHYMAMNVAGQTATVNSMRSKMPAANKMASSHEMAKKVAASCRDHPGMMVHEVMENVMPRTSVMPN
jgi:peptidoglycan hydrolase-like protein with peptidoglycan-binding domain